MFHSDHQLFLLLFYQQKSNCLLVILPCFPYFKSFKETFKNLFPLMQNEFNFIHKNLLLSIKVLVHIKSTQH